PQTLVGLVLLLQRIEPLAKVVGNAPLRLGDSVELLELFCRTDVLVTSLCEIHVGDSLFVGNEGLIVHPLDRSSRNLIEQLRDLRVQFIFSLHFAPRSWNLPTRSLRESSPATAGVLSTSGRGA